MKPLLWINDDIFLLFLLFWAQCEGSVPTVTAALHGTAVLPCSVPFISGTEDLLVSWVKKNGKKPSLVLHTFIEGQFNLTYQAPQYRGRTNMSPDLSNGRLDLTLTHVEHRDEGVYVCQVSNTATYRDIEVGLSVFGSVRTVTAVLHGTAVLPCSVPFISGTEDLHVSWVKKIGTKPSLVLHTFIEGQFDLTHQAPQYRGRTNMSPDLSNGRLDLTLTHVEHRDEGVYVCHVTHPADYRDIEVRLTVIEKKHRNEHDIVIGQNFLGRDVGGYIEERSAGSGRVCPGPGLVLTIALLVFFVVNEHFGIAVTSAIIVCNV